MLTCVRAFQLHSGHIEASPTFEHAYGGTILVADPGLLVVKGAVEALVAYPTHGHQGSRDLGDLEA